MATFAMMLRRPVVARGGVLARLAACQHSALGAKRGAAGAAACVDARNGRPLTLFDKIWRDHVVCDNAGEKTVLLYVDRHLVYEVTSPQAFEGLRTAGRAVRRPDCTLATVDHNVPTSDRSNFLDVASFIQEPDSRTQVMALEANATDFALNYFSMADARQGIIHVIGPEQGFTLPGQTIVAGDSHTATHGALGALAFGVGTSEVEHVLATQTLLQKKPKNMRITVTGLLAEGVTSKDLVLHIIGRIGTAGGNGHVIEFAGEAVQNLSMEARMSMCNMAIEGGARAGMVAPDDKTFEYVRGRPLAPMGTQWDAAVAYWRTLPSDPGAHYDTEITMASEDVAPTLTWGTSPQDVAPVTGSVPDPAAEQDPARAAAMTRALEYMGLSAGDSLEGLAVDRVFIGSCTNSRIEDLRAAAAVARGRRVAPGVKAMVVPGSGIVKAQAIAEGLDVVLREAGFDFREPGCSMCLGMNPDRLLPRERCASTSNRNFEGRQGALGRSHLMSPAMAAAAAVTGTITDVRSLDPPVLPLNTPLLDAKSFLPGAAGASKRKKRAPKLTQAGEQCKSDAVGEGHAGGANGATGMEPFLKLKGVAAPLDLQNVDTDMIIPKQFLTTIKRTGLGVSAFYELRYDEHGAERPDFVLNQEPFRRASILVTGDNFGCGSSREHAPWAIKDFGIRAIIATSFADIFHNNCYKNGMLPITLPREQVLHLIAQASQGLEMEVDLEAQEVRSADGSSFAFQVDAFQKHCLMEGLDDIGLTLARAEEISSFEARRAERFPWLDDVVAQKF